MSKMTPKFLNGPVQENNHLHDPKVDFSAVDDFYILLDNQHKSWLPGDEVLGQIILISKKNLMNVEIMLSLIGCVRINASSHSKLRPVKHILFNHTIRIYGGGMGGISPKTSRMSEEVLSQGGEVGQASAQAGEGSQANEQGEQSQSGELHSAHLEALSASDAAGSGISPGSVFDISNSVSDIPASTPATPGSPTEDDDIVGLDKGEHRFPFVVKLPNKRIFTSIDFGKGSINYLLRACIGNGGLHETCNSQAPEAAFKKSKLLHNLCHSYEKVITLISPIDVSKLPPPKPKRLIIKDPRTQSPNGSQTSQNGRKLSRTQSTSSTISSILNTSEDAFSPVLTSDPDRPSTIKVSLELPQKGFLRGELIPVKLNINHLKKVQDLNGIIVTFVRVCRLENGSSGIYESFRKDLQQAIIPLYVDPVTFQSDINTSVRVPADSFPTITGCPLVSFQYFVEVLINLSGKSLSLDETDHTNGRHPQKQETDTFLYSPSLHKERVGFVNTDKFKRLKKFLQLTTEVIIGTHRTGTAEKSLEGASPASRSSLVTSNSPGQVSSPYPAHIAHTPLVSSPSLVIPTFTSEHMTPPYESDITGISTGMSSMSSRFTQFSDKERMRAHEAALLPSAPEELTESDQLQEIQEEGNVENVENGETVVEDTEIGSQRTIREEEEQDLGERQFLFFTDQDDLYHEPDAVPEYQR